MDTQKKKKIIDQKTELLLTCERKLNRDVISFARDILGVEFFPNQAKIMKLFYDSGVKEILIVCGKKSGKDFMAAIFGLFQIYKLLLLEPSPQEHFGILADQRIYIPNVAVNKSTAKNILLDYTKKMIGRSEFLKMFLASDMQTITEEEIRFKFNLYFKAMPCVSSASLGYTCGSLLLDELDFFKHEKGENSGQEVYDNMTPNLEPVQDFGKVIMITSPNDIDGIAYKFASDVIKTGEKIELGVDGLNVYISKKLSMMFVNAPTWVMNPRITRERLQPRFDRNPDKCAADFGAEFLNPAGLALNRDKINESIVDRPFDMHKSDELARVIALDPGLKHDAYALLMGYKSQETGKYIFDYAYHWQGTPKEPVQIEEVENHIRKICEQFKIHAIAIDQHQSESTVQRLSKEGLPIRSTHIGPTYNTKMYINLIEKLNTNLLELPNYPRLIAEMKVLRRIGTGAKARFEAPNTGLVTSDDLCDALSMALYTLCELEEYLEDDVWAIGDLDSDLAEEIIDKEEENNEKRGKEKSEPDDFALN